MAESFRECLPLGNGLEAVHSFSSDWITEANRGPWGEPGGDVGGADEESGGAESENKAGRGEGGEGDGEATGGLGWSEDGWAGSSG